MPPGLTKMQQMAWKKKHAAGAAPAPGALPPSPAAPPAKPALRASAADGGGEAMPAGLSKMQQMAWIALDVNAILTPPCMIIFYRESLRKYHIQSGASMT
jgi:hypothetical protein